MADTSTPTGTEFDNDTRQTVFLALVDAGEARTPSAIAAETDTSRELAYHHLSKLVEMGLVTRSDGQYRPQPVFTDPTFREEFVGVFADLVPEVADRVALPDDADAETLEATVFNCLRMAIAMNVMGDAEPPDT